MDARVTCGWGALATATASGAGPRLQKTCPSTCALTTRTKLRQLWRLDFSQRQREWAEREYGSEIMNRADEAKQKIWDTCQDPAARIDAPRVYYLRFGDRIKIGATTNLRRRLQSIPHDRVLAVEPGGVTVERRRHREFGSLRITGEWFRPGNELMSHIVELKRKPATGPAQ